MEPNVNVDSHARATGYWGVKNQSESPKKRRVRQFMAAVKEERSLHESDGSSNQAATTGSSDESVFNIGAAPQRKQGVLQAPGLTSGVSHTRITSDMQQYARRAGVAPANEQLRLGEGEVGIHRRNGKGLGA